MDTAPRLTRWQRLLKWQHLGLLLIVIITLLMHIAIIALPPEPMFDEQFYIPDARRIINGYGSERYEHPPLGKLFPAAGILLFGDTQIGWRLFSVLCGTLIIVFFYFICRKLGMSDKAVLLGTFLFSFENLVFVQASISMLDVYSFVFMMAAFYFYLNDSYLTSGVVAGFSTLAKLNGGLALIVIFLHWLIFKRNKPKRFTTSLALAPVTFIALLPLFSFLVEREWVSPIKTIDDIWSGTSSLTFDWVTHEAASRPWTWLYRHPNMDYWYHPEYYGELSFTVWALIIPAFAYLIYRVIKRDIASGFSLCWFAGTYLVWIPVVLIFNRVTYPYYIYPAVGAVCIGIALGLTQLLDLGARWGKWRSRLVTGLVAIYCLGHIANLLAVTAIINRG